MRACVLLTTALLTTALLTTAPLTGCGTAPPAPESPSATPPSAVAPSMPAPSMPAPSGQAPPVTPVPSAARPAAPGRTARTSSGWEITVYYTAVERFHGGEPTPVTGCTRLDCTGGDADLGSYPADFVDAVRDEGTGQTIAGQYLNWSYDVGFWLDSAPRTSAGGVLEPFVSAAADPEVLPPGTRFTVAACGRQEDGSAPDATVCAALRDADWQITDEFTPGLGGPLHVDAYIGPETGPGFTDTAWYLTLTGARLALR